MSTDIPLRQQRDYRLLWSARTISFFGAEVSRVAVPVTAVTLLQADSFDMGVLTAAASLPYFAVGLHAGAVADRLARHRPLMIACDLLSAAAVVTVPLAWAADVLTVWWLIVVVLMVGACGVVFRAAGFVHLTSVVPPTRRTEAVAGMQVALSLAAVGGPALAGLLLAFLSPPFALSAEALAFFISACLLRLLRGAERHRPGISQGLWRDTAEGLRVSAEDRALRRLIGCTVTLNFFSTVYLAIQVLYLTRELTVPGALIGVLTAGFGVGGLAAGGMTSRVARRLGERRLLRYAVSAMPAEFALLALAPHTGGATTVLVAASTLLGGVLGVLIATCLGAVLLNDSPKHVVGRVNAVVTCVTQGAITLGGLAGGLLGGILGLRAIVWLCAAGVAVAIPLARAATRPGGCPTPAPTRNVVVRRTRLGELRGRTPPVKARTRHGTGTAQSLHAEGTRVVGDELERLTSSPPRRHT
ncbi:MFS transporter [Microbispora sp. NEAU-D428]|uniref:MFS transporter n=1 Tax=Microbispora sitophila TaxID=2771537 RepID=UPI00186799E2|nr:MFS transporter [Microbispora sitophila]MBE3014624.1 MFS transporter [Microbispora sitophila]